MRNLIAAGILICGLPVLAQTPQRWADITSAQNRASVAVIENAPYSGAPWASIVAQPQKAGIPATARAFALRAWQENGRSRVVVYAVTVAQQNGKSVESETQIATHLLDRNESVQIAEVSKYGAAPVTITVIER
jgi:hypothetical protein